MSSKLVGQQLRKAREQAGWTLQDATRETRIKSSYLQSMEEGDFDALPSPVQVQGFLRSYSNALGINSDQLLQLLTKAEQPTSDGEMPTVSEENSASQAHQAEVIFLEISTVMKSRRELLGLSLSDVAQFTHISERYLSMIERAAFNEFPSPLQAQGMIGNYANFLEMDRDAVLLNFAEGLQAQLSARQAVQTPARSRTKKRPVRKLNIPSWLRNLVTPDRITVVVVVTSLILFIAWGLGSVITTQENLQATPTSVGLASVLLPTDTPPASPLPETGPTPTPGTNDENTAPDNEEDTLVIVPTIDVNAVQIFIIVRQRTWLRITVDEEVVFDGRVQPGANLPFSGNESIELLTGNAAALQIFYNDRDMGILGIYGEVINTIYTRDGLLTPTPLASPTIDFNATPTLTPTPLLEN